MNYDANVANNRRDSDVPHRRRLGVCPLPNQKMKTQTNEDQAQLDELAHPYLRRGEQVVNLFLLNFLLALLLFERGVRRVARTRWRGMTKRPVPPRKHDADR